MRDADYLRSVMATYYIERKDHNEIIDNKIIANVKTYFPSEASPWHQIETISTHQGQVRLIISQLPETFVPNASRAMHLSINVEGTSVSCVQVLLRADIAYRFHLPFVTVGGHYNHMPLAGCTSPSSAMLSFYKGYVPLEALYLLSIPDCTSAIVTFLTNPLVPIAPRQDPQQGVPTKRKGRPSTHQPLKNQTPMPTPAAPTVKESQRSSATPSPTTSIASSDSANHIMDLLRTLSAQISSLNTRMQALESSRPLVPRINQPLEHSFRAIGNPKPLFPRTLIIQVYPLLARLLSTTWKLLTPLPKDVHQATPLVKSALPLRTLKTTCNKRRKYFQSSE